MNTSGTLQPGETVKFDDDCMCGKHKTAPIIFGQDTIASLKEKERKEKAAKKKLPKNFKPLTH